MNKRTLITIIPAAALLLLAACTQDELGGQGNELPYGEYPLQIGGVTFDVESSAEPWSAEGPQTRVAENDKGTGSVWQWNGTETIGVRLGNETTTYKLNAGPSLAPDRQLYWTSTAPATVTAWYPVNETVDLSDQSNGLVYVLKAEAPNATYDNEITLGFKHQLAKVRVVLSGTQASLAQSVEVYGCTTCTNNEGTPIAGSTQDWIKMKHTTSTDGTECWEANVVPGTIDLTNFIRLNGHAVVEKDNLTDVPEVLNAANMYTINLTVGEKITNINKDNTTISDDGYYRVSGTFNQQINITEGKPTIYLENANIAVSSGNAINITSGNPTIYVSGNNSIVSNHINNNASGIYVATGSSLTISGNNMEEDVLRVTAATDGAAIGGYSTGYDQHTNCGDITISNVTVYAETCGNYANSYAPGIGSTGNTCGTITITNAIVHARSFGDTNNSAPAIGAYESVPEIVITGSEIHAYRGSYGTSYADYIGQGGNSYGYHGGDIQCGTGSITNTTVYKGAYNCRYDTSSNEGSVYYDEEGLEIIQ